MRSQKFKLKPFVGLIACVCMTAQGQTINPAYASAPADQIIPGERLSDWLLRNTARADDLTVLHWRVNAERGPQRLLKQAALQGLQDSGSLAQSREQLVDLITALPLTGRLTVAAHSPRWLQAALPEDPLLQDGHSVMVLPRPKSVAVLTEAGVVCMREHFTGASARDYVASCLGADAVALRDWVWLAQPDGRTGQWGIAAWNANPQPQPAPGAWIWAPGRKSNISSATSDNLIRVLATQLPAEALWPKLPTPPLGLHNNSGPSSYLPIKDLQITASDWGEAGLLQTPSARMESAGAARMHLSGAYPYTRLTAMLQPFNWLEAGFRYTDIANRLYGPKVAEDQSYKDKSIDLKLRLLQEDHFWPQVAVGLRDAGGTGLFSSEYVVSSKRWGNWDASLGLGWGYMAAGSSMGNPLSIFGEQFNTRAGSDNANGGTVNFQSMFHGKAAVFGGVQWQSPNTPWVLKAELEGNDYKSEPLDNPLPSNSALNLGAVYRYSPYVDFSMGWERGNRFMMGVTLHTALDKLAAPKVLDPALPPVRATAPLAARANSAQLTSNSVALHTGWKVLSMQQDAGVQTLVAETDGALMLPDRTERAISVLHQDAPPDVKRFVLELKERGLALSRVEVDRAEWVALHTQAQAPAMRLPAQQVYPGAAVKQDVKEASGFQFDWGPSYSQILGGPDGFLLYELGLQTDFEHRFSESTWVSGTLNARLLDNYQNFKYDAASDLPRVRTLQREYVTTSRVTMPLLQATHVSDLGSGHYASVYAGMLESMYGGVGAEWLYRPWKGTVAFGVDVNAVKQRDFHQDFAFRDYTVNTGHATLYWDTGWNDLQVKLSAGQYLAGDVGATLDIKRVFPNGVAIGAWATKTNVSADQFGEGSFDKAIYVSIPFDLMLPKRAPGIAKLVWDPLTRDGGARLNRAFTLFDLTNQRDSRAWSWAMPSMLKPRSAEENSYISLDQPQGIWSQWTQSLPALASQSKDLPASAWLWAGGAVLASSLLDKDVDNWAINHQGDKWQSAGKASNAVPYLLALGTGALLTGVGRQGAANTASDSVVAALSTLGVNAITKFAVGRSRPEDGFGPSDFRGFTSDAARSGFASNHVALAFALATPFAQQHDMPWLYLLAGSSAFGRIQNREHFLSDTVAGGLMGYAIGSMVSDQRRDKRMHARFSASPQAVAVSWVF